MADKAWKRDERKVAGALGTERNPLSGGMGKHSTSDSLHEDLYIETKRRRKHAAVGIWDSIEGKAKQEGKVPVVALTEHGRPGFWVVVRSDHLSKLLEIAGRVR